jgi:aminopeptidase N
MYNTLLTPEGFRKGMDLYFERHDGSAVTCDDFRLAMADANGIDLEQFSLWYSTPGTPTVTYSSAFDADRGTFTLTLSQKSNSESPLHIPIAVGLIDKETGEEVVPTTVLELKKETETFEFPDLKGDVVPSILRGFSAPVKLVSESGSDDEAALAFLAARDTDGFNKWEAGQKLHTSLIFQIMDNKEPAQTLDYVNEAFGRTLADKTTSDYSIKAYALTLPTEGTLAEEVDVVDPVAIRKARGAVKRGIARKFQSEIKELYDEITQDMKAEGGEFQVDATSVGRRRLRNVLLDYLCSIKETPEEQLAAAALATEHFEAATGMTDKLAALSALASMDGEGAPARDAALEKFYKDADGDALVLNKWFTVQALADLPDVLERVKELAEHPDFTLSNPNRCRSLVSAFTMNAAPFHDESGAGYQFLGDIITQLDKLNPQISSRIAGSLIQWRRYDESRGTLMKAELEKLVAMKPISDDLFEVVSKGLKSLLAM